MKWSKIIILCCVVFIISCTKEEIVPIPQPKPNVDIFTQSEVSISNGDSIMFKLTSDSTHILKLIDVTTNQVISKEKIMGKIGENKIKIYTKSVPSKYLYIVLEDINKNQKGKTKLTLN